MPWYERAKAGDKVVCVDDTWERATSDDPKVGNVYEIEAVVKARRSVCGVAFDLVGFPIARYSASCFRPVQTKSTESGMHTLRSILNGNPITEKQDDRKRVDA